VTECRLNAEHSNRGK